MKNIFFNISFNKETGTVSSIINPSDDAKMNWCHDKGLWGKIHNLNWIDVRKSKDMELISFKESEVSSESVYSNEKVSVTVNRFFEDETFVERYTIKNLRNGDLFLEHGELGIEVPFDDVYTYADDCMINKCNTHIWCGYNSTYVNALKMGYSDINLGLVLTKGSINSYSLVDAFSNDRGRFLLNCEHIELMPNEEYVIEWKLFWHKGYDDFCEILNKEDTFFVIETKYNTVFEDENIEFSISGVDDSLLVSFEGQNIPYVLIGNKAFIKIKPMHLGEHKFLINCRGLKTYTDFFVAQTFEKLVKNRIDFIINNQQYSRKGSQLDGAYLSYDNREKTLIFDSVLLDHNACRERVGMALLMAKYLQVHSDAKVEKSLDKYIEFLKREFYEEKTGEVFGSLGKQQKMVRLYNAPWVITLFAEMYFLKKDRYYLENIIKMLNNYYTNGGEKFYPNGFSMSKIINAFRDGNMPDEENITLTYFKKHVDNIMKNGLHYPKHEANYEQTIVTPAVLLISEMYMLTGDKKYLNEAKLHVGILERFNGRQPSFHLDETPIRHWDDFWFGKAKLYGDTFPHYWSCLTSHAYEMYCKASNDKKYYLPAQKGMRNCLCLFNSNGEAYCAYVYPFMVNGIKGRFYDDWANDQDFALYFAMECDLFNNG